MHLSRQYYWWLSIALGLATGLVAMAAYQWILAVTSVESWRNAPLVLTGPLFGALFAGCLHAAGAADGRRARLFALAVGAASILALASFFPLMWIGDMVEQTTSIRWWRFELWLPTVVAAIMGAVFGLLTWAAAALLFEAARPAGVGVGTVLLNAVAASMYGQLEGALRPAGFLEFVQLDMVLLAAGLAYGATAATLGRALLAEDQRRVM